MKKTIAIIGAGIGGLVAGCYAQMKGYQSEIFEAHTLPGGVCTSWKRKGYTFDGCIHHLPGLTPGNRFYDLWSELGIMPGLEVLYAEELTQVEDSSGRKLTVFTDLDRLADHVVLSVPSADASLLARWIMAMRGFRGSDLTEIVLASPLEKMKMIKRLPDLITWGKYTLESFADKRLTDPFLKRAFPTILYDTPSNPLILQMNLLVGCSTGSYGWPKGGSLVFARTLERRYKELGGTMHYKSRVKKVRVSNDRAKGVVLEDGAEQGADVVISNAYGRTTIFDMLDGAYTNKAIRAMYSRPVDEINMGVQVCLGVDRDLSNEPHSVVLLLDRPVQMADERRDRIAVDIYSYDPSMAPKGKSVIKVAFETRYSYWNALREQRELYEATKAGIAETVIENLEGRFGDLKKHIEVVDVATPLTTERYTGIAHPFKVGGLQFLTGMITGRGATATLPGLDDFYMVGQWAGLPGITSVAASGRQAISGIEARDRR